MSRIINDKLLLYQFCNVKEIITDRNVGTGAVQCGTYIATALIIGGSIHGEGGGLISALVFFILGQGLLILFGLIYNKLTPFDLHEEIEKDSFSIIKSSLYGISA